MYQMKQWMAVFENVVPTRRATPRHRRLDISVVHHGAVLLCRFRGHHLETVDARLFGARRRIAETKAIERQDFVMVSLTQSYRTCDLRAFVCGVRTRGRAALWPQARHWLAGEVRRGQPGARTFASGEDAFQPPPSDRKDATAARADSVRACASASRVSSSRVSASRTSIRLTTPPL